MIAVTIAIPIHRANISIVKVALLPLHSHIWVLVPSYEDRGTRNELWYKRKIGFSSNPRYTTAPSSTEWVSNVRQVNARQANGENVWRNKRGNGWGHEVLSKLS